MTTATIPVIPESTTLEPSRWQALAVILIAAFMVLLDTSIVTNAITKMQTDLDATYSQVQFVLTAYTVAYGMLLITGGRLGDLYGRKRVFILGLIGFVVTSTLCGLAPSALTLIIARILQGLSAAMVFPQISSFIQVLFPVNERPRAFGLQGAIIGLGIVTGPLLGGFLIDANLFGSSWRPIFLINIPIGILAWILAARILNESKSERAERLDIPGVLLVSVMMFLLTYPIIQGREEGWPAWIVGLLVASVPVLIGFLIYQNRLLARGGTPLVQLSMFSDRAFAVGALITLVFQASVLSYFVAMTIFFQAGLGYSPASASLLLIAYQIAIVFGSLSSPQLGARLGRNVLTLGIVLLSVGLVATLLILRARALDYQGYELILALLVSGFGFGCVIAPLSSIILARINPVFAGSASGVLSTIQQLGTAIGVALMGVIYFGQLGAQADTSSLGVTPQLEQKLQAAQLPAPAIKAIVTGFQTCFHDRSNQSDPNAIPASCQPSSALNSALPASIGKTVEVAVSSAATQARKQNFLEAVLVSLRFQLVTYAICFLLIFWLPNARTTNARPA